jgi:hypothetical protein
MKANTRRTYGREERKNVRDDSPYCIGSSIRRRTPYLATQQWVGILSSGGLGLVLLIVLLLLLMGRI